MRVIRQVVAKRLLIWTLSRPGRERLGGIDCLAQGLSDDLLKK
jgi:hypothetical protein